MISLFFLKLLGEKRLVKSVKILSLSIKSINSTQKYPHITESDAGILKPFVTILDILITFFNFFLNMFNSKTINVTNIIIQCIQSNPMIYNIAILIKFYYICPIFYFIRRLYLEQTQLNLVHSDNTFVFQN